MKMNKKVFNSAAYLTTKQLADRWQVNHRTLQNWRVLKKGPRALKLENGMVRYAVSDILTYEHTNKILR